MLLAPACGDDSGVDESAGNDESSGTTGSTEEGTTESPPETTTGEDASGGGTSTGPGEDGTSTGTGADSGTAGSETSVPGDCAEAMDMKTCEGIEGCIWLGNNQDGVCAPDDASVCPMLMSMQVCNAHPACEWNNQDMMCNPA